MAQVPLADRLAHVEKSIDRIEGICNGMSFDHYLRDPIKAAATERFLEKICEAAKYIPEDQKALHPEIPWVQLRGLGNRLRHGYETIDHAIVWDIVQRDLQPLRSAILQILERAGKSEG